MLKPLRDNIQKLWLRPQHSKRPLTTSTQVERRRPAPADVAASRAATFPRPGRRRGTPPHQPARGQRSTESAAATVLQTIAHNVAVSGSARTTSIPLDRRISAAPAEQF